MSLEVLKPGLLSTFQDLGRTGWQAQGMPVCGAMDGLSHRIANLLVGNACEEATLEITLAGPSLRFHRSSVIALAGADLGASLHTVRGGEARPLRPLQPVAVPAGSLLEFGRRRHGTRAYLALAGGFGLPEVMGSTSTYLRAGLGGWQGRALRKGDRLELPQADAGAAPPAVGPVCEVARAVLMGLLRRGPSARVRLMPGPEWDWFDAGAQQALMAGSWRIATQSDRMGLRLEGPLLKRREAREMLSEPVAFGTVQLPADGQPIVLMADRQTTGGYPRIAQVAGVDLPVLAQRMPGDSLRFEAITLARAQGLLQRRARALERLREALDRPGD